MRALNMALSLGLVFAWGFILGRHWREMRDIAAEISQLGESFKRSMHVMAGKD